VADRTSVAETSKEMQDEMKHVSLLQPNRDKVWLCRLNPYLTVTLLVEQWAQRALAQFGQPLFPEGMEVLPQEQHCQR
jgi:hypothetical protein